jgi:hypothetical protein
MRINATIRAGYIYKLDCEISDTIESVKAKIHEDGGPEPDEQTLIYRGAELEDGYTLSDYNIKTEDTLEIAPSYETRGIKFDSLKNQITGKARAAKETDEEHTLFTPGVNLVGKCDNSNCCIRRKTQYFRKGFGTF